MRQAERPRHWHSSGAGRFQGTNHGLRPEGCLKRSKRSQGSRIVGRMPCSQHMAGSISKRSLLRKASQASHGPLETSRGDCPGSGRCRLFPPAVVGPNWLRWCEGGRREGTIPRSRTFAPARTRRARNKTSTRVRMRAVVSGRRGADGGLPRGGDVVRAAGRVSPGPAPGTTGGQLRGPIQA